jgi:PAS domain S-box-containing protein
MEVPVAEHLSGVSLRVLIVEDRQEDAQRLVDALERASYRVSWERVTSEDAFRVALATTPDLILSDYELAAFDARGALRVLDEALSDIPFILVAGALDEGAAFELTRSGMDDFLHKDRLTRLGLAVARTLRDRDERRRRRRMEIEQAQLVRDLRERVKELKALHGAARLLAEDNSDPDERFRRITEQLPPALQYPELAVARLTLGDRRWQSQGFQDTEWKLVHAFSVPGDGPGSLEVGYRRRPMPQAGDVFLDEERALLATLAEMIEEWIQGDHSRREMARAALMLANVRDAIIVTDAAGLVTYWNEQATRQFGWTAAEMIGRPLESRYSEPDLRRETRQSIRDLLAGREWFGEYEDRRKDGSRIWIDAHETPIVDGSGAITGIISISRDITARKHNEVALEEARTQLELRVTERTRELAEREALISATLDALSAHIALLDPQGRIVATNRAWKAFARENGIGWREVSEGVNYLDVCEASAQRDCDGAREVADVLRDILDGSLSQWNFEYPCPSPEEERWFLLRARPVVIKGRIHALLAHENISQMKITQEELRSAAKLAEQANRAKSGFLMTMSHELRTPLNGVLGMNELLLTTSLDARQREYVGASMASGRHLLQLINDVLDLSRIEAGKMGLVPATCPLVPLVTDVVASFAPLAQEHSLVLAQEIADGLPETIRCDCARLQQLLVNLIGNALKFTPEGRIDVRVDFADRGCDRSRLRFKVSDTGIGIPEDRQDRLFKTFSQVDDSTSRRYGGSGLGLSICRELVELMGGDIGVRSRVGAGSTFWFEIPVESGMEDNDLAGEADDQTMAQLPPPVLRKGGARGHVLVAEDNHVNLVYMCEALARLGYSADVAGNGHEVLQALDERRYDLVLMDCQMPGMDGFEASRAVRRRERDADDGWRQPIVAVTANASPGDRERCLEADMDDYISKPVTLAQLQAMLVHYVREEAGPAGERHESDRTASE